MGIEKDNSALRAQPQTAELPHRHVTAILSRARQILEPKGAWTQGDLARTSDGVGTHECSFDAACWCVMGAIWKAVGGLDDGSFDARRDCVVFLQRVTKAGKIASWNDADGRTQAEVLAAIDAAIALANLAQTPDTRGEADSSNPRT